MAMTLEDKNRTRYKVRMFGVVQWGVILLLGAVGWLFGLPLDGYGMLATASTTGMTTLVGLDYFSKPSDPEVK
jgi:hypothetical protein